MEETLNERKISFSWDIHWKCNFRCPYCWWHNRWEEISNSNYYPGIDRLMEVWKRIYKKYGGVHIEISGGEPMLYSQFFEFLSRVLAYHTVSVTTNFCGNVKELPEKINDKKGRFKINATFHPLFADFDEFIKKVEFLRKNNFAICVLYLAWPPQIKDIPVYEKEVKRRGLQFSVLTFWGKYNNKDYPESYTKEEKEIISSVIGRRSGEEFQASPLITRGKLCNAGHTYGTIHPDGVVLRCGGGAWKGGDVVIGNIFDKDFKLLDGPQPCYSENCPCNEWAFLLVGR